MAQGYRLFAAIGGGSVIVEAAFARAGIALDIVHLDLRSNGTWVPKLTVDLLSYDAGTDSGPNFTSPNSDTNPQQPTSSKAAVVGSGMRSMETNSS